MGGLTDDSQPAGAARECLDVAAVVRRAPQPIPRKYPGRNSCVKRRFSVRTKHFQLLEEHSSKQFGDGGVA